MTTNNMINGYDVCVRGQFHRASGKDRTIGVFGPVTFFLPEVVEIPNGKKKVDVTRGGKITSQWEPQFKKVSVTVENVALYIIQRRLLPTWLAENYPDCVRFRTCSIVPGGMKRAWRPASEAVLLDKPVSEMSLAELRAFCHLRGLNVALQGFSKVEEAREAVQFELDQLAAAKAPTPEPAPQDPQDPNAPEDGAKVPDEENLFA